MSVLTKTKLTLESTRREAPDVISFRFKSGEIKKWRPGQYLHCTLEHPFPDRRGIERCFTVSSAPYEGVIQITTRFSERSSTFKKALRALPVGGSIDADGLDGDFTVEDQSRRLVFIAGGIGVTPYRSILLALNHAGTAVDVDLLYANRDENFPFRGELELLAGRHSTFRIRYFAGPKPLDEAAIRAAVGDLSKPLFYVSGPQPMVESCSKILKGMSVSKLHIKLDDFPGYAWP